MRVWYNGSYTMMAKSMKTLQLCYPIFFFRNSVELDIFFSIPPIRTVRRTTKVVFPHGTIKLSALASHLGFLLAPQDAKHYGELENRELHDRQLRTRNNYMKVSTTKFCHLSVSKRQTRNSQFTEKHNSRSHFCSC